MAILCGEFLSRKCSSPMCIPNAIAHVNHAANRQMNCRALDPGGFGNATPTTRYATPNSTAARNQS